MLISPTEPTKFHDLGKVSWKPEKKGCDFLVMGKKRVIGVQRKKFPEDLLASLGDNRLYTQVRQMEGLSEKMLIVEGYGRWTNDGELIGSDYMKMTVGQLYSLFFTLMFEEGIPVLWVRDMNATYQALGQLDRWVKKTKHTSLKRRSGPKPDSWGTVSNKSWGSHLLQSFPGVGPDIAEKMIEHFGYVPLTWTVSVDEMMQVPGVGKTIAGNMDKALAYVDEMAKETGKVDE